MALGSILFDMGYFGMGYSYWFYNKNGSTWILLPSPSDGYLLVEINESLTSFVGDENVTKGEEDRKFSCDL